MTRLSCCHEVILRILNGQEVDEVEKRKISFRLRQYKMNLRSQYGVDLNEYIDEVDDFLQLLSNDEKRLPLWFLRQTKFCNSRLGMINVIVEVLTGYVSVIGFNE